MKRAALLFLLVGAPLLLVLFPGLLRALGRKARFLLLLVSGLTLAFGALGTFSTGFAGRPALEKAFTVAGLLLLGGAWLLVAHAALTKR